MIFTVWMLALVISLTQLGWKDETWKSRIEGKECTVNQDKYFVSVNKICTQLYLQSF